MKLMARILKRLDYPVMLHKIQFTYGKEDKELNQKLETGKLLTVEQIIQLPENVPYTYPHWLLEKSTKGTYEATDPTLIGLAEAPSELFGEFTLNFQGEQETTITYSLPVVYKWVDQADGEEYLPFKITPMVTANPDAGTYLFIGNRPREITLSIKAHTSQAKGNIRLILPKGWKAEPRSLPFTLVKKGAKIRRPPYPCPDVLSSLRIPVDSPGAK
jgi:hypothetical protein